MSKYVELVELEEMIGLSILNIEGVEAESEEINFKLSDGNTYKMFHNQNCCEHVRLNDFEGDVEKLSGGIIVEFREYTDSEDDTLVEYPESFTWTFYNIRTTKGDLWLRWLGESNGYYGESVEMIRL